MRAYFNLGEWIREKWKTQVIFAEKVGVTQGRVSKWLTAAEGISADYQAKIRKLGYQGPWPTEETKEAPAPAAGPYLTREDAIREIGRLEGRIEALERAFERLAEGFRHHMTKEPEEAHPQAPA